MITVTLSRKQYDALLKEQEEVRSEVMRLKTIVRELAEDEVRPSVLKRLNARSALIEKGGGKRFSSVKTFRQYLRAL